MDKIASIKVMHIFVPMPYYTKVDKTGLEAQSSFYQNFVAKVSADKQYELRGRPQLTDVISPVYSLWLSKKTCAAKHRSKKVLKTSIINHAFKLVL